jgi:excisionase family DNA binding protein
MICIEKYDRIPALSRHYVVAPGYSGVGGSAMETLFTIGEAAQRLRVSKWTIASWLSQGRLARTKVGARTLIRASELEKLLVDGGKSPAPRRAEEAV